MKRREAREKAFQFLFQIDMNEEVDEEAINDYILKHDNDPFLRKLIEGVMEEKVRLDGTISKNLENWTFNRLPSVERTALRLATYEVIYLDDIPENVSINEAVELGHQFGDDKSGKFINGVLSNIIGKD